MPRDRIRHQRDLQAGRQRDPDGDHVGRRQRHGQSADGITQRTGTLAQLTPTSLTFAAQTVGTTSAPQTATLTDVSTNNSIKITSVTITGANAADFAQTNNCGTSLAAGLSCSINVTFTPSATGARSATLTVNDDGGGLSQSVALAAPGCSGLELQ